MRRSRVLTPLRVVITFALSALVLVTMPGTQARADPSVAEIEARIGQLWNEAEQLIEDYNLVHANFQQNKARQEELSKKIEPLQREIDLAQLKVGAISARVYVTGPVDMFNAMITAGSPSELADRLSFLDQLAHEQELQVHGSMVLRDIYDQQKAPIDELVRTLATQDADLATRRKDIETRLDELQDLRRKAYGTTSGTGSFRPWPCPAIYEPTPGYKVASFACHEAGKPYLWAAAGPNSYDCSGLVLVAWRKVGVYLPHQSRAQRASIPYIKRADLRLGDLIFYFNPIHHVAIYVGDGKIMQAPHAGDYVRMSDMDRPGSIHSYGRPG